jgi:hypothetical protein
LQGDAGGSELAGRTRVVASSHFNFNRQLHCRLADFERNHRRQISHRTNPFRQIDTLP